MSTITSRLLILAAGWWLWAARPMLVRGEHLGLPAVPRTWDLGPDFSVRLRGRIDTDAVWAEQSVANRTAFGELDNVVGLRRARVGVEGAWGATRRYIAEIDLASGAVVPRDVYFAFGERRSSHEYQVGHFREPFSLEGGTSARHFAFLERSPANTFDPARNWGLCRYHESIDEQATIACGAFYAGTGDADIGNMPGSTFDFTTRFTTCPINDDEARRLLHFGLALSGRFPTQDMILINQSPRSPLLELGDSSISPFVKTLRIPSKFQQVINLQSAATRGSFWAQCEWYGTVIDQVGADAVFYHGCHFDFGYFLTGEHRGYEADNGTFGAVRVNRPLIRGCTERDRLRGWGAWEVAARYAYLDLLDVNALPVAQGDVSGTRLSQSTVGLNWYLCDRIRWMFNYSYSLPATTTTGTTSASIVSTRLAIFW